MADEDQSEEAADGGPSDGGVARRERGGATDAACERLLRLAHSLGPNTKLPPVRRLREQFGVSRATLDAALTRLERQRVLTRRERSGVYVAPHLRARSICLLCAPRYFLQNGVSPFWSLLIEQIRSLAQASEVRLTISFTHENAAQVEAGDEDQDGSLLPHWLADDIESGKVHGVLAVDVPKPLAHWIEERGVPVVAYAGPARYIVATAGSDLIQLGVAALARRGCRHIAFWRYPPDQQWEATARFFDEVFVGALAAHGLTPGRDGWTAALPPALPPHPRPTNVELGWELAMHWFGEGVAPDRRPDAILSPDDMITQGSLMALHRLGVRLGHDVHVATHANRGSSALLGWQHQISLIEYDLKELVRTMFETLDALMDGGGEAERRFPFETPDGSTVPPPERYRLIHPRLVEPQGF